MSYEVFQCPECQQFISTKYEVCRFCEFPLSDEIKAGAIAKTNNDNTQYRLKMHKAVLYSGLGIFVIGVGLSFISIVSIFYTRQGFYFPWSPIIVLFGLGQMLIGFMSIREERKK